MINLNLGNILNLCELDGNNLTCEGQNQIRIFPENSGEIFSSLFAQFILKISPEPSSEKLSQIFDSKENELRNIPLNQSNDEDNASVKKLGDEKPQFEFKFFDLSHFLSFPLKFEMISHEPISKQNETHSENVLKDFTNFAKSRGKDNTAGDVKIKISPEVLSFEEVKPLPENVPFAGDKEIKQTLNFKPASVEHVLENRKLAIFELQKLSSEWRNFVQDDKIANKNLILTHRREDEKKLTVNELKRHKFSEVEHRSNNGKNESPKNVEINDEIVGAKNFKLNREFQTQSEFKNRYSADSEVPLLVENTKSVVNLKNDGGQSHFVLNRVEIPEVKVQDVIEVVKKFVSSGEKFHDSEIILKLEPKELGKVIVKVSEGDKGVRILFEVKSEEVKRAIESSIYNLKTSLEGSGVSFEKIGIKVDDFGFGWQNSKHEQSFKKSGRKKISDYSESVKVYGESLIEAII